MNSFWGLFNKKDTWQIIYQKLKVPAYFGTGGDFEPFQSNILKTFKSFLNNSGLFVTWSNWSYLFLVEKPYKNTRHLKGFSVFFFCYGRYKIDKSGKILTFSC